MREQITKYIKKKYNATPEYLWKRFPGYAIFRHDDNKKWFVLIGDVTPETFGLSGKERIDVVNVKIDDPMLRDILIKQDGYFPGYHMNKASWVSVLLDGTVPFKEICGLIDDSYKVTASTKKKEQIRGAKDWIIPSNPKYYDILHAFDDTDEINWKQGSGIKSGDMVYLYVGAPVSAILYKCKVLETDIPYQYQDGNLTISALMKIKLQKRYKQEQFPFSRLRDEFGVNAVRGPRGIPNSLKEALLRQKQG